MQAVFSIFWLQRTLQHTFVANMTLLLCLWPCLSLVISTFVIMDELNIAVGFTGRLSTLCHYPKAHTTLMPCTSWSGTPLATNWSRGCMLGCVFLAARRGGGEVHATTTNAGLDPTYLSRCGR